MAVAVAGSYSSDLTPSLGVSMSHRCSPKKAKKKKNYKDAISIKYIVNVSINIHAGNVYLQQIAMAQDLYL
mgnify:CR=1 FL=1